MAEFEFIENTMPTSNTVDALFRHGLRALAQPPTEQVWQRIQKQVQSPELRSTDGSEAEVIPPSPWGMEVAYLLGMTVRSSV
ncbi:MAG TPA: hypothetical protein PKH77_01080 [Anaerolineae bacterium]|nr:hypothetical protein [Anaerolineae bacterium]